MLALDRGRGMTDISRCMQDGYSTAGSPGTGLGAITRLADNMRIYSRPGQGCAIMARFRRPPVRGPEPGSGAVLAPYPGEQVCGDNWAFSDGPGRHDHVLVDGAGHGVEAARAADVAVQTFAAAR